MRTIPYDLLYKQNIIKLIIGTYLGGLNLNNGKTIALKASDIAKKIQDNLTLTYS